MVGKILKRSCNNEQTCFSSIFSITKPVIPPGVRVCGLKPLDASLSLPLVLVSHSVTVSPDEMIRRTLLYTKIVVLPSELSGSSSFNNSSTSLSRDGS